MASKHPRKVVRSKRTASKRRSASARAATGARPRDPLLAPIRNAIHREIGGVIIDIEEAANGRVKRVCYPPGFRWSTHMKPIVNTELCMHAHVGFLAAGEIHIQYADGCTLEFAAPQVVAIEPGHDGWVVGDEPAVMIEVDFEGDTANRFGMSEPHKHR